MTEQEDDLKNEIYQFLRKKSNDRKYKIRFFSEIEKATKSALHDLYLTW